MAVTRGGRGRSSNQDRARKTPDPVLEPGVELLLNIEAEGVTIVQATRVRNVARTLLRAPSLVLEHRRFRSPVAELALAVLADDGRVLGSFGWPAGGESFYDRPIPRVPGGIRGTHRSMNQALRVVQVPLPRSAAYLFFYRSELARQYENDPESPLVFAQRALALYWLPRGKGGIPRRVPPLPLPMPDGSPQRVPAFARRPPRNKTPRVRFKRPPFKQIIFDGGYIESKVTVHNSGAPDSRFDIVVTGDGFQNAELATFDQKAAAFVKGLMGMAPFAALADKVNVHVVRVVSLDSGVDVRPVVGTPKRTFFNVEGNYENLGYSGDFGTDDVLKIQAAAEKVAPFADIEVVVVLVNAAVEGGHAWPDLKTAIVPLWTTDADLVSYGAHECGHVIARLSEEYIGGEGPNGSQYPNQATESQRLAGAVPWVSLAKPQELDAAGNFKVVHDAETGVFINGGCGPDPDLQAPQDTMLGLFWGCQDIDPSLPAGSLAPCNEGDRAFIDPRGADYYRPMASCRMRIADDDFCRVCSAAIAAAITAKAF